MINAESKAEADELRRELEAIRKENAKIQAQIQAQKEAEESEKSLRKQAAENRFASMLKEIPVEFQEAATMMFKGYSDSSEGLIAITKYKAQGLFGKKTIEVVSRVPREQNNNETKPLSQREVREKRVSALKSRRQGLVPGAKL
jgi:cell division septum initiation protein DivIVA